MSSSPAPKLPTADSAIGAVIAQPRMAGVTAGSSSSAAAMARLESAVAELKAMSVAPLIRKAIAEIRANDGPAAGATAFQVLEIDERNGFGWYLLAISREMAGDFGSAIKAYESALALLPDQAEVANDLGRLAYRLGMKETAEKLFRHYLARFPTSHEAANNLACAVRDQGRFAEAIDILRPAILNKPDDPLLWNTMGTIVGEEGDPATSMTFFDEALRLDPKFAKARYNRGNARLVTGDPAGALEDCETAMMASLSVEERLMMQLSRSTIRMALGDLGGGWDDYEARIDPRFPDSTRFLIPRPRWDIGTDLAGKTLLVFGEQGLGDEAMFANLLPDVIEALGPDGRLLLAVEQRLVPLFQRSFPQAEVVPHVTGKLEGKTLRGAPALGDLERVDLWTPMASLLCRFRRFVEAFPDRPGFLKADPERVAYWKSQLARAGEGPKVGLLWKSLSSASARHRFYSPFEQWKPVLETPGVTFVNLQYGDCAQELETARRDLGVEIWNPPGIDLKQDLDDVAALACAMDVILGPANATSSIAAACGAPLWMLSTPGSWTRLGTERQPWYPQAKVFIAPGLGQWEPAMQAMAEALSDKVRAGTSA